MTVGIRILGAAFALGLLTAPGSAQVVAPAPGSAAAGPGQATPDTDVAGQGGSLSDKLSTTNGVIHPRDDIDPGIHKPAPTTGTMPVIPPPGGSGNPQPK